MKNGVNEIMEQSKKVHGTRKVKKSKKDSIDFGVKISVNRVTIAGVKKLVGLVYDFNADKSKIWIETKDDVHVADIKDVELINSVKSQPTKGFNHHNTKLNKNAVSDIYALALTTNMTHQQIANWVELHYDIEIVPKTVSDIKLGKRWGKYTKTLNIKATNGGI